MQSAKELPREVREAVRQGLLERLPLTFVPFTNQQIHEWNNLFEFERRYLLRTLTYLGSLDQQQFDALFRPVREIEARMDLASGPFSTSAQTMQNSSWLARSPYFLQWRREVERVFEQIDRESAGRAAPEKPVNRLLLVVLPARLPLDAATVWARWQGMGNEFTLDLPSGVNTLDALLKESLGPAKPASLAGAIRQRGSRPDDVWLIEAEHRLESALIEPQSGGPQPIALSYERLKPFCEGFLERINTIQKDLADADAVYARLRQLDLGDWCPPDIASRPPVREFLRSLFLSGNAHWFSAIPLWSGPVQKSCVGPALPCSRRVLEHALGRSLSPVWPSSKTRSAPARCPPSRIFPPARWTRKSSPTIRCWQPCVIRSIASTQCS